MKDDQSISILDGNTFVLCDRRGDLDADPTRPHGLYHQDTRFLSRWKLTVDGQAPELLSTDDLQYFVAQFFLVPPRETPSSDARLSILRRRSVGTGFHEDLTLLNHGHEPVEVVLRLEVDADFADLFQVKDAEVHKQASYRRVDGNRLVLGYRRERFVRETTVWATKDAAVDERGLTLRARVPAHGEWTTCVEVVASTDADGSRNDRCKYGHGDVEARPDIGMSLERWLEEAPRLETSWAPLERTYRRSLTDLAALRFYSRLLPGAALPAAGLPWYMAVFGRDSLIASLEALPFHPALACTTLTVLAALQGDTVDDFREEDPGKILHEIRYGELTAFEERPHSPYYGAADTTPLYLILLDEYERWTGDRALVRALERPARRALAWMDTYGDRDDDGYLDYRTRNPESGLENQCWKDSPGSIVFADGSPSSLPRATCELQGYAYDAKRRAARLAREVWGDAALADRLEHEARALKERFNRDYWLDGRECFALAIDGERRLVDSLTSNIGHLLFSGIADEDKAAACVRHLMNDALHSGWGVRTMARGEGGYNPIGYHVGTVWPHDTAIIAWGLRRYGYHAEAATLALEMLEAARFFDGRLPEAFAGYPRALTRFPVEYPTACSPQAWAAGAPLLLLRVLLGLEPDGDRLTSHPVLPPAIPHLTLRAIPGRWGRTGTLP